MTRTTSACSFTLLLAPVLASFGEARAQDVGDRVVVVRKATAMIEDGSVGELHPGVVFVVQKVNGDWLWPSLPKPGWVTREDVRSLERGLARFEREIDENPRNAQAHWGRAEILRARGEYDEAITSYDAVVRLAPNSHVGYLSRGACRLEEEKFDEALRDFATAAKLAPKEAAVHQLRKVAHAAKGDFAAALADADEAVALAPKDARGLNSRAWLRATCPDERFRDGTAAVVDATKACQLTGFLNYRCVGTLAAAHAEAGDFEQAVRRQKQATKLAPPDERAKFEARLQLYQRGEPYHAERGGEIR